MASGRKRKGQGPIEYDAPTTQNIRMLEDEEENAFAQAMDEGHRLDPRAQKIFIICIVLLALYFIGLIVPKNIFNEALHYSGYNAGYTVSWFLDDLMANVNSLVGVFTGQEGYAGTMILYIVIALTGAGLALTGAVYQGSFRNALVSPSTLGVMNGATLGMMIWAVFFVDEDGSNVAWLESYAGSFDTPQYLWSTYSLGLISFIGCLVVVGTVLLVMRLSGKGAKSPIMLIITGQVIGAVLGAVSNSIRYYYIADNPYSAKSELLTSLQIASFYRDYTIIDVFAVLIPVVLVFIVVMRSRRRMMLLTFSEDEAKTMGVDSKRMQYLIVGLCTLLTAILISFCGRVGFVGFLVPHLARRLVGPSFSYLLPAAAMLGAVFVLGAYVLLMITLGPDYETMVGMFISIFGSGVFLVTALRGKGGARGEFR